jgi:phosphatidylserine synthase
MTVFLKIIGTVLLVAGCVLTYKPNLISNIPLPENPYQMTEVRVKWGFLIGLGILFIFYNHWSDWKLTVCAVLSFLTLGIIITRLFGFVLDGFFSKQLLWLTIEIVALIIFGILYRYADN